MQQLRLIIGNKNYSSWSLRPWFFMQMHNIAFTEQRIALFTPEMDEVLAKYNSDNKVPLLIDNDLEVWDSLAILEYVSETYLKGKGWPSDSQAKALGRCVSAEMHSSFGNLRNDLPMNCRLVGHKLNLSADTQRDIDRVAALWRQCREQYQDQGDWLLGEFSIADAMYAPVVLRLHNYGVAFDEPIIEQYMAHVLAQDCLQQWITEGQAEIEIIEEDEV